MTFGTYWTSSILNQKTVSGSQFYAEYIYNAFALNFNRTETKKKAARFLDSQQKLNAYSFISLERVS